MEFKNATILLPAINETYSLKKTVEIIFQTCKYKDIAELIILLSKKSTQQCVETANTLCQKYPQKVWICYQKLPYVGGACREGFALAKGSHVVLMSTDLETDPGLVCKFIKMAKKDPEAVITASRWMKKCQFRGYNKLKKICNWIFQKLLNICFFTSLSDMTYAFRIFPAALVKKINWEELRHPFFLETALKPLRLGVKFLEIPANWEARSEGESQNGFLANFKYFKTAWHIRFCRKSLLLKE